jgi:hypothetical protein
MIMSASPCPAVVSRPTLAPRLVTIALVPTVVPLTRVTVSVSNRRTSRPPAAAAASNALKNPSAGFCGVVGALPVMKRPAPSSNTAQSVKVPPISTPTM